MNFVDRVKKLFNAEKKGAVYNPTGAIRWQVAGLTGELSGHEIMRLSYVYACIRNISEDVAKMGIRVIKRNGKNREVDYEHTLNNFFGTGGQPNHIYTTFDLIQGWVINSLIYGCGYIRVVRDAYFEPVELYIIDPRNVTKVTDGYELINSRTNQKNVVPFYDILELKCITLNGISGKGVSDWAGTSFANADSLQQFSLNWFKNGGNISGMLETSGPLTDDQFNRIADQMKSWTGGENVGNIPVLEAGVKFNVVSPTLDKAQLVEAKKSAGLEVCSWFRMPPHKVQIMEGSTFSNIEHQGIEYVTDTIQSWVTKIEQEINRKLVRDEEKKYITIKFNLNTLLRGDSASRAAYLTAMVAGGIMEINEARSVEDLNPVEGGDELRVPLQNAPIEVANQHFSKVE